MLSFTNTRSLGSNFVNSESFLEHQLLKVLAKLGLINKNILSELPFIDPE